MKSIILILLSGLMLIACREDGVELKIDKVFEEFQTGNTPGAAVGVYKDGEIAFKKGYGQANLEMKIPISTNTDFRLASITKQFTAMCILILSERGELSFDDNLQKFFPDFPEYGSEITVKHLLTHTSGLLAYENFIDDTVTVQLHDSDVLEILKRQDSTYFEPGTMYRYSNTGYAVLALIVEKVSGKSFAQFLEENIFEPLHMYNSVAYQKGINEVPNRAFGYAKTDSGFVDSDQSLTSAVLGDGGIYTSVEDMYQWDLTLGTGKLISKELMNEAWQKAELSDGSEIDYGYGWRLDEYKELRRVYHTGSTCGFSNVYMRFPEKNLSVIVLMNIPDLPAIEYGEKVADLYLK